MSFSVNDNVAVKRENPGGTRRTPNYIRGKKGRIIRSHGTIGGHSHDHAEDWGPLYTVIFEHGEVFESVPGRSDDKIAVDIHENWLEPA